MLRNQFKNKPNSTINCRVLGCNSGKKNRKITENIFPTTTIYVQRMTMDFSKNLPSTTVLKGSQKSN